MHTLHVKRGDLVKVRSGKDQGKTGKVMQVFPKLGRIVVEGVHVCKKHVRARKGGTKGQVVEFFMPIDASTVVHVESSPEQAS